MNDSLDAIAAALGVPNGYGHNLDSLNDCLTDVAAFEYGSDANSTGTVMAIAGFDPFATRQPKVAQDLLDIFASGGRWGLLFGHRMLWLIQSDDPDIRFDRVGATDVQWNPVEWSTASRRP